MAALEANDQEVDENVEREQQLYKYQHGPVHRYHIEGKLYQHKCCRHSRQQIPYELIIVTNIDQKLARLYHSNPKRAAKEYGHAEDS